MAITHEPLHCTQDCVESKFRSSPLKSDMEKKKRRHICFFFFVILCNDNDIIDMNNAVSATTLLLFFSLSFYNPVIFTPPQKRDVLSSGSLYCKNITIRDVLSRSSQLLLRTFLCSPRHHHGLNTDSMAVPLAPCILRCDCIDVWFF